MKECTRDCTPQGQVPPNSMGCLRCIKQESSLDPQFQAGVQSPRRQQELAKILKPLVGKSPHHVHNTSDFVKHIKGIRLHQDECIMSYGVKALFTSVPIVPAIKIIKDQLVQDRGIQQRTTMPVNSIICLLGSSKEHTFCVPRQIP